MGYHGKPSRGCDECRSRKIRCDLGKPWCNRCATSGRRCPGYRDLSTLIFRDERARVTQRAAQRGRSLVLRRSPLELPFSEDAILQTTAEDHSSDGFRECRQQRSLTAPDQIMLEPSVRIGRNEAVCFFHQQFWWESASLEFSVWQTQSEPCVIQAIAAVGMATLSMTRGSPSLKRAARDEHTLALQGARRSLCNSMMATSDATLQTVVLLSLFETIIGRTDAWEKHANGAATLMRLRGQEQLKTPMGLQLFLEARGHLMTNCLLRSTPVPPFFADYCKILMKQRPPPYDHDERLSLLEAKVANLRASIHGKSMVDVRNTMAMAYAIEGELLAWEASLPPDWSYVTIRLPEGCRTVQTQRGVIRVIGSCYHIYPNLSVAGIWGHYRASRLLINDTILNCFRANVGNQSAMMASPLNLCRATRNTMHQLSIDVCDSIPYILGLPGLKEPYVNMTLLRGYMGLLPLLVAGAVMGREHLVTRSALEYLNLIGESMGIGYAISDIVSLKKRKGMVEWIADFEKESYDLSP